MKWVLVGPNGKPVKSGEIRRAAVLESAALAEKARCNTHEKEGQSSDQMPQTKKSKRGHAAATTSSASDSAAAAAAAAAATADEDNISSDVKLDAQELLDSTTEKAPTSKKQKQKRVTARQQRKEEKRRISAASAASTEHMGTKAGDQKEHSQEKTKYRKKEKGVFRTLKDKVLSFTGFLASLFSARVACKKILRQERRRKEQEIKKLTRKQERLKKLQKEPHKESSHRQGVLSKLTTFVDSICTFFKVQFGHNRKIMAPTPMSHKRKKRIEERQLKRRVTRQQQEYGDFTWFKWCGGAVVSCCQSIFKRKTQTKRCASCIYPKNSDQAVRKLFSPALQRRARRRKRLVSTVLKGWRRVASLVKAIGSWGRNSIIKSRSWHLKVKDSKRVAQEEEARADAMMHFLIHQEEQLKKRARATRLSSSPKKKVYSVYSSKDKVYTPFHKGRDEDERKHQCKHKPKPKCASGDGASDGVSKLQVFVKTDRGEGCYQVPQHATGAYMMRQVFERYPHSSPWCDGDFHFFQHDSWLLFNGILIEDAQMLRECGVCADSTLTLQVRVRGGTRGSSNPNTLPAAAAQSEQQSEQRAAETADEAVPTETALPREKTTSERMRERLSSQQLALQSAIAALSGVLSGEEQSKEDKTLLSPKKCVQPTGPSVSGGREAEHEAEVCALKEQVSTLEKQLARLRTQVHNDAAAHASSTAENGAAGRAPLQNVAERRALSAELEREKKEALGKAAAAETERVREQAQREKLTAELEELRQKAAQDQEKMIALEAQLGEQERLAAQEAQKQEEERKKAEEQAAAGENQGASAAHTASTRVRDDAGDAYDAEHRLLCALVKDPEGFFERADADESGDLSRQEFEKACVEKVPNISQEVVQSLFGFFDMDTDGKISLAEFSETIKIVVHYVQEARCEATIVAVLLKMLLDNRPSAETAEEHSVRRSEMMLCKIKEEDLVAALALKVSERLVAHGAEEEERRLKREARKTEQASTEGKFTSLPTAAYGDVESFHKGLEVVGVPHNNILEHMRVEHTESKDSLKTFEAWNSGCNETTPAKVCVCVCGVCVCVCLCVCVY